MLAYAASRPAPVERTPRPNALLAIIAVHVAVVAAVMSAKMDLPARILRDPPIIYIPTPKPPPPTNDPSHHNPQQPSQPRSYDPKPLVDPVPQRPVDPINAGSTEPVDPGLLGGGGVAVTPEIPHVHVPVAIGAGLLTPLSELRPPYPASKLLTEEEAVLRLRLVIDANGRVVAVDPVGKADRVFLEAARRHLIAHWRYKPASEDGRAVASSMVITLRFQLDG